MAQRSGWLGSLLGYAPPRERFSLEELKYLHDTLIRNRVVTDANRDLVVETLRSIAELMIWGDQHEPRFFDYFAENNVLQHFTQFLQKRSNRRGDVAVQVLQTLSILIQNIRSEVAVFYLFSNNHVNDIVALRYDFDDDEVLGYYINLLKTISLKLNEDTVQFFFQEEGDKASFPLYTEAIKFINHRDGLVRAAVRTLTLSVYSIKEPAVQRFVVSKPAAQYFSQVTSYLTEQCQTLDRQLDGLSSTASSSTTASLDSCLGEIEDLLTYCDDILSTGEPNLVGLLQQRLWDKFVDPVLLQPLQTLQKLDGLPLQGERPRVRPLPALYILERLLHVTRATAFTQRLAAALTLRPAPLPHPPRAATPPPEGTPPQAVEPLSDRLQNGELGPGLPGASSDDEDRGQGEHDDTPSSSPMVPLLMAALTSTAGPIAAAAAYALGALLANSAQAGGEEMLAHAGLLPHKLRKSRELMAALTAGSSGRSIAQQGASPGHSPARSSMPEGDERPSSSNPPDSQIVISGQMIRGPSQAGQWVDTLCLLCALHVVPPSALAVVAYLILQLVSSGSNLTDRQRASLARAGEGAAAALREEVACQWCDALPLLLSLAWGPSRASLASPGLTSTISAVQAWAEAASVEEAALSGYLVPTSHTPRKAAAAQGEGDSAKAAQRAYHNVHRFVLLMQLQQALRGGGTVGDSPPMDPVTEGVVRAAETRENTLVLLPDAIPCTVSFTRGSEKPVLLGVHGLPQLAEHGAKDDPLAVIGSAAAVVLATPGEQAYTGTALSVAPLLGSAPFVDQAHSRWLHLHVRPHARGLAKTVRNAGMRAATQQIASQLVDGHWVLSFADAGRAQDAQSMVQRCATNLRERFAEALEPLIDMLTQPQLW